MISKRVTFPMEDLPSMTFWKNVSWPMPQPETTPRPVTTTRCFVAERAVAVRDVGVLRREKAAMPVVVYRRMLKVVASLMLVVLDVDRRERLVATKILLME